MHPDMKSLNNDLTPKAWAAMVYIRPVLVSDLSADLQREAEGIETLYSVHSPDGARVALVADRQMAFALARENDMAPVFVH